MDRQLKIIYHYHSGFSVQVGGTLLVFDYWRARDERWRRLAGLPPRSSRRLKRFMSLSARPSRPSGPHRVHMGIRRPADHLHRLQRHARGYPRQASGAAAGKGAFARCKCQGFPEHRSGRGLPGAGLRHEHLPCGRSQLWHWRQESSLREIEAAENAYYEAIEPIKGERIDLCMFPVDPPPGVDVRRGRQPLHPDDEAARVHPHALAGAAGGRHRLCAPRPHTQYRGGWR